MRQITLLPSQVFAHFTPSTLPCSICFFFSLTPSPLLCVVIYAPLSPLFCFIFFQYLWALSSFSHYLPLSRSIYLLFALAAVLFGLLSLSFSLRSLITLSLLLSVWWSPRKSASGEAASLLSLTSITKTHQPTPNKTRIISGLTGITAGRHGSLSC